MATILRAIIMAFVGAIATSIFQSLFGPKEKAAVTDKPAMDLKRCPTCGVYSSGSCDNPECSAR
jgi:hypothetical protein